MSICICKSLGDVVVVVVVGGGLEVVNCTMGGLEAQAVNCTTEGVEFVGVFFFEGVSNE